MTGVWRVSLTALAAAAVAAALMWLAVPKPAGAHDALPTAAKPLGWSYPLKCCSGYDCRKVGDARSDEAVKVFETNDGYRISTTGEVIPMTDPKVKPSPDGEFHWCSKGGRDDSETICLFAPGRLG